MKKVLTFVASFLLVFAFVSAAYAVSPETDFAFTAASGTITDYYGPGGAVVIPSTIDGFQVKSIGNHAFDSNKISSVVIPDGVTSIGVAAFSNNSMQFVRIPNTVTNIGDYAFDLNSLSYIVIPSSVTNVGTGIVRNNYYLSAIYFLGNAPTYNHSYIQDPNDRNVCTVYVTSGATGWTDTWKGVPSWTTVPLSVKSPLKVAFDSCGGSAVATQTMSFGAFLEQPSNPTRTGYKFEGWFKDSDFISAWDFERANVTRSYTLYAKWSAVPAYEVVFNSQGGSAVPSASVYENELITEYAKPMKNGYLFGGWFADSACTNAWNFSTSQVTGPTTLYAKWIPQIYNIYLNGNGGSVSGTKAYTYGIGYTLPTPSRGGYTFKGWYASSSFSGGRVYAVSTSDLGNKTYYASWYSNSNYLTSMYKSTGTWSRAWSKTRASNTLTLSRSKSSVRLKASISSKAKVYFKYSGHSYSNVTGKSQTIKVSRGKSKTVYFKVVSQSGKSRTYKIVVKRRS